MKDPIHIISPSKKMVSEGESLTVDEYSQLGELFKQFRGPGDKDNIIGDIQKYIDRFPRGSKVVFYFNNWSKKTIRSDPYMSLIQNLRRLSKSVYGENFFEKLL